MPCECSCVRTPLHPPIMPAHQSYQFESWSVFSTHSTLTTPLPSLLTSC